MSVTFHEHRHCDEYINDPDAPESLRKFLAHARAPAHGSGLGPRPPLFARLVADKEASEYTGRWDKTQPIMRESVIPAGTVVRVVMASRFGDVGISTDLNKDRGYIARVSIDQLRDFAERDSTKEASNG